MSVNAIMVSECGDLLKRAGRMDAPGVFADTAIRSAGESLGPALESTRDATERLKSLIRRHRLDASAIQPTASRAQVTLGIRGVLADVQGPLTILRVFEAVDSTDERQARSEPLIELLPSLAIEDDDIEPRDSDTCLAHLSPPDRARATQMLSYASTSLSSLSDELRHLSSLATPSTAGPR